MNTKEILAELQKAGSESTKKIQLKHGAKEPVYGVKVEDLKKIQKMIKANQQQIAMELYETGIADAMYLAGLIADGSRMTKKELQTWAERANQTMITEYTVPWVTSENQDGWELALKWIDSPKENIACTGWATLANIMSTRPDDTLDIQVLGSLLQRIEKEIGNAPNRVRYCMNAYVIAAGSFIKDLNKPAISTGKKIGTVEVDMGGTYCKVPFAPDYIKKVVDKGYLGKKRKAIKC